MRESNTDEGNIEGNVTCRDDKSVYESFLRTLSEDLGESKRGEFIN